MAIPRTVLLVESTPTLLDALSFALRRRGYHVLTATDGQRAAELLARHLPQAVVLDMFLPNQSGFQIARLVKEQSDTTVPVVMLSNIAGGAHRDYALALGVDAFLLAPRPAEVVAAVEGFCPLPPVAQPLGSGSVPWSMSPPG